MDAMHWQELLDGYLDGSLSAAGVDALEDELLASAEARRFFWAYVHQHALIEDILAEQRGIRAAAEEDASVPLVPAAEWIATDSEMLVGRCEENAPPVRHVAPQADPAVTRKPTSHRANSRTPAYFLVPGVAAAAILAVWLLWPSQPLAKVIAAEDCRWAEGEVLAAGQSVPPHRPLQLMSGTVSLRFASGATVVITGRTRFAVTDSNGASLMVGRLLAKAAAGQGFWVTTPAIEVRDFGTQFGVLVDENGAAQLHVFDGTVQTRPAGDPDNAERRTLTTTQAARFDSQGGLAEWIAPDRQAFAGALWRATGVVSTSDRVRWVDAAAPTVRQIASPYRSDVVLIPERRGVLLSQDLAVTFLSHGKNSSRSAYSKNQENLPAGTRVDSYLLHFEPELSGHTADGTVVFERPVLAVIARGDHLKATDALLGIPGVRYDEADVRTRGLDDPRGELVDVLGLQRQQNTVFVRFVTHDDDPLDEVRILVAAERLAP